MYINTMDNNLTTTNNLFLNNLLNYIESDFLKYIIKNYGQIISENNKHNFLGLAILHQNELLVNYLLLQGYSPNISCELDNGLYPLERVIINIIDNARNFNDNLKNFRILLALLDAKVDPNLYKEAEPLFLAVCFKLYGVIDLLLKYRANPYTSIILCINKLYYNSITTEESALWNLIKNLIFKHSYRSLFEALQSGLSYHYNYLPCEDHISKLNPCIKSISSTVVNDPKLKSKLRSKPKKFKRDDEKQYEVKTEVKPENVIPFFWLSYGISPKKTSSLNSSPQSSNSLLSELDNELVDKKNSFENILQFNF